jgi:glycosyltransferase involved in cell wall biosynthesis
MRIAHKLRISIIIPTLNRADRLRSALTSVRAQTLPSEGYEIIVVDNGSTDDTEKVFCEFAREETGRAAVRYVREDQLGLHFARHAGAKIARGQFLAFMDDDATADPNWLQELLKGYSGYEVGCVGGKILPIWEAEPPTWVRDYGPGYLGGLDLGDHALELREPAIYGSNLAIRKSTLVQVRGFNPDSFGQTWLGDGEIGLLRKVLQAGWKIMYNPKAVVWHYIPASRMTLDYLRRRSANQGASNSYTAYRNLYPSKARLAIMALEEAGKGGLLRIWGCAYSLLGSNKWYHKEIRASYYWRRFQYDLRLIYDELFRNLVKKDDWFEST